MLDTIIAAAQSTWNFVPALIITLLLIWMGGIGVTLVAQDYHWRRNAMRIFATRIRVDVDDQGYWHPIYEYRLSDGKRYEAMGSAREGGQSRIGEQFELFVFEHDPLAIYEAGWWRVGAGAFFTVSMGAWLFRGVADSTTPTVVKWTVTAAALYYCVLLAGKTIRRGKES